ncbi:S8 family peptidase [Lacihabitans soyangensis]|uniref:S8 family peptidase n=1 Tax=Lacihabitans soyangensis TaxID=869394 RepID=A0AAE3H3N3_9BACT|nr:S8 family peptidase [Lacihabitans soyangensis]MCP9763760.1 S8 family peptidase [Lacihabitans soyangensis]
MKKTLLAAALVAITISCNQSDLINNQANVMTVENATTGTKFIPGKYIVVLKGTPETKGMPAAVRAKVVALLTANGANASAIEHVYSTALTGFSAFLSPAQAQKLLASDAVDYIEQDAEVTISQKGKPGGGTTQPAQEIPWGITAVGGAGSGAGKTAWIIDTGIDLSHPDLNVDATRGFSAFSTGKDAGFDDGNGHGTHVAGTVAALNNTIGVVGVAAGAKVVPVKVLGARGSGSNAGVIAGVDWVAANGQPGDAANMSLGGGVSTALDQAVLNASNSSGVKFALAAGNETDNANNHSPARVNGPNIVTVSAHNISNVFASFSNYGNPPVDICAPGVSIKSTWIGDGYNTISGTSMATPHVCGILLLGNLNTRGTVSGDPDGNPDGLASR